MKLAIPVALSVMSAAAYHKRTKRRSSYRKRPYRRRSYKKKHDATLESVTIFVLLIFGLYALSQQFSIGEIWLTDAANMQNQLSTLLIYVGILLAVLTLGYFLIAYCKRKKERQQRQERASAREAVAHWQRMDPHQFEHEVASIFREYVTKSVNMRIY